GRAAAPGGRPHGRVVRQRLVPARGVQPETADEEALGRNPDLPRTVHRTGGISPAGTGAAALPRPRGNHGLRKRGLTARALSRGTGSAAVRRPPPSPAACRHSARVSGGTRPARPSRCPRTSTGSGASLE